MEPEHNRESSLRRANTCSECHKTFSTSWSLKTHMSIHTGKKPYPCTECHKTFRIKDNLKRHIVVHTDQRPFPCKNCDKTFKQKTNLIRHQRMHSEKAKFKDDNFEKDIEGFSCTKCHLNFNNRRNLKQHEITHKREKNLKCKHCDMTFQFAGKLIRHELTHRSQYEPKRRDGVSNSLDSQLNGSSVCNSTNPISPIGFEAIPQLPMPVEHCAAEGKQQPSGGMEPKAAAPNFSPNPFGSISNPFKTPVQNEVPLIHPVKYQLPTYEAGPFPQSPYFSSNTQNTFSQEPLNVTPQHFTSGYQVTPDGGERSSDGATTTMSTINPRQTLLDANSPSTISNPCHTFKQNEIPKIVPQYQSNQSSPYHGYNNVNQIYPVKSVPDRPSIPMDQDAFIGAPATQDQSSICNMQQSLMAPAPLSSVSGVSTYQNILNPSKFITPLQNHMLPYDPKQIPLNSFPGSNAPSPMYPAQVLVPTNQSSVGNWGPFVGEQAAQNQPLIQPQTPLVLKPLLPQSSPCVINMNPYHLPSLENQVFPYEPKPIQFPQFPLPLSWLNNLRTTANDNQEGKVPGFKDLHQPIVSKLPVKIDEISSDNNTINKDDPQRKHQRSLFEAKPCSCAKCGKSFKNNWLLKRHSLVHSGNKPHSCSVCYKAFKYKQTLQSHRLEHTREKSLLNTKSENIFEEVFSMKGHLLTQLETSKKENQVHSYYPSGREPKEDKQEIARTIHELKDQPKMSLPNKQDNAYWVEHLPKAEKVATNAMAQAKGTMNDTEEQSAMANDGKTKEKAFACNKCCRKFSSYKNLMRHGATHTGEKTHACKVCHKSFFSKYHLRRHETVHTGERQFPCEICNINFSESYRLLTHERSQKHAKKKSSQDAHFKSLRI